MLYKEEKRESTIWKPGRIPKGCPRDPLEVFALFLVSKNNNVIDAIYVRFILIWLPNVPSFFLFKDRYTFSWAFPPLSASIRWVQPPLEFWIRYTALTTTGGSIEEPFAVCTTVVVQLTRGHVDAMAVHRPVRFWRSTKMEWMKSSVCCLIPISNVERIGVQGLWWGKRSVSLLIYGVGKLRFI